MINSFIDYFIDEYYTREIKREYHLIPVRIRHRALRINEIIDALHYFMLKHKVSYDYLKKKNKAFIRSQPIFKGLSDKQIIAFIVDEILSEIEPEDFYESRYERKYQTYAYVFKITNLDERLPFLKFKKEWTELTNELYIKFKFITNNIVINNDDIPTIDNRSNTKLKYMGVTPATPAPKPMSGSKFVIADHEYSWLDIISIHYSDKLES